MMYCTPQYEDFARVLRLQSGLHKRRIGPAQVFGERSLARACAAEYTAMMPSWPTITVTSVSRLSLAANQKKIDSWAKSGPIGMRRRAHGLPA